MMGGVADYMSAQVRKPSLPQAWPVDRTLLVTVLILLGLGLVMVGSASVSVAEKMAGEPFYYLCRPL